MDSPNIYTFVESPFFESIDRYEISAEFRESVEAILPEHWTLHRSGIWLHASCPTNRRAPQGFKIHLSGTPVCAARLLTIAVPECVEAGVDFKVAADPKLLSYINSKRYGRGGAGKFVTIYPPDIDAFRDLIERLHQATRDEDLHGPYILSDRRYKDSRVVYYRYGGFAPRRVLRVDGTRESVIRSPSGESVPDPRRPFFELPDWVRDPFPASDDTDRTPVLNERYRIEQVLAFSNSGGIYEAIDLRNDRPVVVKEARPYTNQVAQGRHVIDSVGLLEREHGVLLRLAHLDFVPAVIDLFSDWEHRFLVEEKVAGVTFGRFWAQPDNILTPFIDRPGRLAAFVPKFRALALDLIRVVHEIHDAGVLIGDLSPHNVFVDPESLSLSVIDFESALVIGEADRFATFAGRWATPGFASPDRLRRKELRPEDDYYAVGMLLFSALAPVQAMMRLDPAAPDRWLGRLLSIGLPDRIAAAIGHLRAGAPKEARSLLAAWHGPVATEAEESMSGPAVGRSGSDGDERSVGVVAAVN